MAYGYTPNNWKKYDDSKPLNEQLETIITKEKLEHIEEGIKNNSIERRIGNIISDPTKIIPNAQYRIDKINGVEYLDIIIPGGSSGIGSEDGVIADRVGYPLKFTGAATAEFDGSSSITIKLVGSSPSTTGEIFNDYTNNKATGNYAHAEGEGTIASSNAQHVEGKYNVEDTEGKYLHILGGGTSNLDRKNIHTVDLSGNAFYAGNIEVGGGDPTSSNQLITKQYADNMKTDIDNSINNNITNINNKIDQITCTECSQEDLLAALKTIWPENI